MSIKSLFDSITSRPADYLGSKVIIWRLTPKRCEWCEIVAIEDRSLWISSPFGLYLIDKSMVSEIYESEKEYTLILK